MIFTEARQGNVLMTEVRLKNYRFDPANPPDLTAEQQAELEALQKMTDENIDFSDIPATSEEDWKNAVVGKFHQTSKKCDDDFLTDRPDVISDEGRFSWI